MHDAEEPARRGLQGRPADEHDGRQGGRDVGAPRRGEGRGDRRLGRKDDRLGGHEAAGCPLFVGQQAPDVLGLLRLHALEQLGGLVGGQLGDEVGGVVGLHDVEDVGRPLHVEAGENLDPVLVAELLQDVGQALVRQLAGHRLHAPGGQLAQHVGDVGGLKLVDLGEDRDVALDRRGIHEPGDLAHGHGEGPLAADGALARAHVQRGQLPFAGLRLGDGDVDDDGLFVRFAQVDVAFDELGEHERFGRALGEAADVDDSGGDDLAVGYRGDAGKREEDAALSHHLDDEADGQRIAL